MQWKRLELRNIFVVLARRVSMSNNLWRHVEQLVFNLQPVCLSKATILAARVVLFLIKVN